MIKDIEQIINNALLVSSYPLVKFTVEKTKNSMHGDFSTNVAMMIKKTDFGKNFSLVDIAKNIVNNIKPDYFKKIDITNSGFINFYLSDVINNKLINDIHKYGEEYPIFEKQNKVYNVEYVSANPTGYLHVGHAKNAVFGNVMTTLLRKIGIDVITEYIVNDKGNQMNLLASSVLIRYKQLFNIDAQLPTDSYHGSEIIEVAKALKIKFNDQFINLKINDKFIIEDTNACNIIRDFSGDMLLSIIKSDLKSLGIEIDIYHSEKKYTTQEAIDNVLKLLKNDTYELDGALWLATTKYGDDKDRVLIKSNHDITYFLPDIIYHNIKLNRTPKPDKLIDVWGSDHYSYITRMQIALKILGYENMLDIVTMQMVKLLKNGKEFKMSKRTGESLTLKELVDTLGKDITRYFMISTSPSSHLELDIDIATKKDNNNPFYYIQYAHARCNSLLTKNDFKYDSKLIDSSLLIDDRERELIGMLHNFQNVIWSSTLKYEPHRLVNYILQLAKAFHSYYGSVMIISNDKKLTFNRLSLVSSVKNILRNSLNLLGIDAYNNM